MRPVLEYACPAWAPIVSQTNLSKLQSIQNAALRVCTGHTRDTNHRHYHDETQVLPIETHTRMISSIYRENCRSPDHPLHEALHDREPDRDMKRTVFNTTHVTTVHSCDTQAEDKTRKENKAKIHTQAVKEYLANQEDHPLLGAKPPKISTTEQDLSREMRRTLAQLRAQKCPMLQTYKHHIGVADSPTCPLCRHGDHTTAHLFNCQEMPTVLTPLDLWHNPVSAAALVIDWREVLSRILDA